MGKYTNTEFERGAFEVSSLRVLIRGVPPSIPSSMHKVGNDCCNTGGSDDFVRECTKFVFPVQ